ncbi:MAG: 2,3-diphosphoglycerate-dependent phosphoglycerate mutase [Acidimicrobiales bacterium]
MAILTLLRHGQSTWNLSGQFTGWVDVDLTTSGVEEAEAAGEALRRAGISFDIALTSVLQRAIRTQQLALKALDQSWLPESKSWRLNERHYGALQGLNKAETAVQHGAEQVLLWRRSYTTRPPAIDEHDDEHPRNDRRYRYVAKELLPGTECLKDVLDRMLPYWFDVVTPLLLQSQNVLISAHGNSIRALVKHLEDVSDEGIIDYEIANGVPIVYEFDDDLAVRSKTVLEPES